MNLKDACFMLMAHIELLQNEAAFALSYDDRHIDRVKLIHKGTKQLAMDVLIGSGLVKPYERIGDAGLNSAWEKAKLSSVKELEIAPYHYALNAFDAAYRSNCSDKILSDLYLAIQVCHELHEYSRAYTRFSG